MPVHDLKDLHKAYADAVNSGSVDALLEFYEDNATFITGPGAVVTGKAGIREVLLGFLAAKPRMRIETKSIYEGDPNLALVECRWELDGTGPDGSPIHYGGTSREVLRRHANGNWLYVIDDPGMGK